MSLISSTRIGQVRVAFKAVNTLFACSQRNKKLLTSAQQNYSTPFFRCRKHDPATTSSMMMTGLHTRTVTASPLLQATGHPSGAPKDREKAGHVEVLRDPYEWKSAYLRRCYTPNKLNDGLELSQSETYCLVGVFS